MAGTGTAGNGTDYNPAIMTQLNTPIGLAFSGGHLIIADSLNYTLRIVW